MKVNNIFTRIASLLMCLSLVFVSIVFYAPKTKAESLSSLKDQQSTIQSKIEASEKELAALEKEKAAQEKMVTELNKQLSSLSDEYEVVNSQKKVVTGEMAEVQSKVDELNAQIEQVNIQIAEKNAEIDETVELFCKRMRANYMAGETSTLELLTNSADVGSFLNRLELFKRVTESDQNLVNKLNKEIEEIEGMKKELETKKSELQGQLAELEVKRGELQSVENDINATLSQIESKSAEVNKKLASIEHNATDVEHDLSAFAAQEKKIQAAINAALAASNRPTTRPSGSNIIIPSSGPASSFMFPIKYSNAYISSGFGYRSASISGNAFHGGIDIAGANITGQNVYASRAGTVIVAEHYSNSGYGRYVMIDHGDGYQTLYGHNSVVLVNVGQHVQKGQAIAQVGSTGNVTGPHLHFEVRYQGTKMNPLNYVSM